MSQLLNLTLLEFKRQSSKLYFFGLGFDSRLKSQMFLPAAIVVSMSSRTFAMLHTLLEPTVSRQTLQPREWIYEQSHAKWRPFFKGFQPVSALSRLKRVEDKADGATSKIAGRGRVY